MIKLGILLTKRHRLLSVAAILDIFETVNSFRTADGEEHSFQIQLLRASENEPRDAAEYAGYSINHLSIAGKQDLIFIPAFNTKDLEGQSQKTIITSPG